MKKFLSLVLALIMTMSLVTISAGATEYRDLTDKDEIQYEEAVAVLNRIGVITGYEDGSFRPEGELTRGAAAKIIVSLLIGPEAASNLPNATAPYPDVPASHTFAGVISYCKTAGIISGYGDGTFKPANSLTGFAFAKMLLGALGYKSEIEGFVDTGWTMNVAKVGNVTGLFDRLDFDGAGAVNRETACQLALNTLKATMVTYGGTTMVTGAQTLAVQGTQAMYVTSNNREINANINRRVISAANNEMTLEFGEEHFKDLRLEHDKYDPAYDDFGHPSNEWSWKKVTIGTFKLPADFTYTKQMSHLEDTAATKEKALGLRNYDTWSIDHRAAVGNWSSASSLAGLNGAGAWRSPFDDATQITINGWNARVGDSTKGRLVSYDASDFNGATKKPTGVPTIAEIADLTDNGVTVEVYVCPVDADFITNVVVTRTQLMKIKRIGADYVTLEDIKPDSRDPRDESDLKAITGYNAFAIDVTEKYDQHASSLADVKDSNYDAYNALKDLKAGDRVAVVPYTTDEGRTWEVGEAYVPETVSGAFTKVDTYANMNKPAGSAVAITVGGTSYPINEWNKDMLDVTGSKIKATKKDVTLYLAKDGTVLWADEIGNSDAWMIVGDYYQATNANLSGKVGWYVHGWTIGGDEVDLDLGTIRGDAERYAPGELVHYYIAEDGNGEYALEKPNYLGENHLKTGAVAKDTVHKNGEGIYEVSQYTWDSSDSTKGKQYQISKRNGALALENYKTDNSNPPFEYTLPKTQATSEAAPAPATPVKREVRTGNVDVPHDFKYSNLLYDGVKFIFVNFDAANGEVETIEIKDGVQNVDYQDLVRYNNVWRNVGTNIDSFVVSAAEAYVNSKGLVKAVVIKSDSSEADLSKIAVITDTPGDKNLNTGAEGDRVNGLSYAKQYVTGPNFSIADEKTGYFDKDYAIGTILVISEKENYIVGKYFHSTYYNNGNPDAVYVEGIKTLKDTKGNDSEAGFLIGQTGSSVYTLNKKNALLRAGNTSAVVPGEDQIVDLLGNKFVSGFDTYLTENQDLNGLVRVDGNTTFVDLRPINTDRIDSMSDLLDFKPETLKLRILVNGNDSTDTFRRAYAVIVENGVLKDKTTVDTSSEFDASVTTKKVNEALANNSVTIVESWVADGTTSDVLEIPAGTTLRVKGDLSVANLTKVTFGKNAKLVVDGTLRGITNTNVIGMNANIKAKNVVLTNSASGLTYSGTMEVTDTLTVNSGTTVTFTGTVTAGSLANDGTIHVLSTSSLHVSGNVTGTGNIVSGDGLSSDKNGFVEIKGEMNNTFIDKNIAPSAIADAPVQVIAVVKGNISMGADSKLAVQEFTPSGIALAEGAEITLKKGTDNANLIVKDTSGNTVDTGTTEITIVIGDQVGTPATGSSTTASVTSIPSGTKAPVISTETTTDAPVDTTAPFTAEAVIIKDSASLSSAVANEYRLGPPDEKATWSSWSSLDAHGKTTMPWLFAKLNVADITKSAGTEIIATVKKDGTEVATEVRPLTADATLPLMFHWDMNDDTRDNPSERSEGLGLKTGELGGTYTIEFNWKVDGAVPAGQEPVTATVEYTEPAIASNYRNDQAFTVEYAGLEAGVIGATVKVTEVIDLTVDANKAITVPGSDLPLVGESGRAWFAEDAGYTGAVIVKITNPDYRYQSLTVASSAVPEAKADTFDSTGTTYVIMGVKPTELNNRYFQIVLKAADSGAKVTTTLEFNMDYSGATIPPVPTPEAP